MIFDESRVKSQLSTVPPCTQSPIPITPYPQSPLPLIPRGGPEFPSPPLQQNRLLL
ncbi:hypothetical protein FDUTEX481_07341 [Tolypothrix sp. PCC 7601]|nr:hypothetical protein FDUTEX481_07341 [Tolypothrix sp. PCC 7601]